MACLARLALSVEEASTSSRLKPYLAQAASPNTPMALPSSGLVRPSQAMWSSISVLPYLMPVREPLSRCGALVIDSMPPATTTLAEPALIRSWHNMIAFLPEPHTLLMRSDEHQSELQSLMRLSYAVFCLKKNNTSN